MKKMLVLLVIILLALTIVSCKKNNTENLVENLTIQTTEAEDNDEIINKRDDTIEASESYNLDDLSMEEIGSLYLEVLLRREYKKACEQFLFSSEMKTAIDDVTYKQIIEALYAENGEFIEVIGVDSFETQGYQIYQYHMAFENKNVTIQVTFNGLKEIAGLNYVPYIEPTESIIQLHNSESHEVEFGTENFPLSGTLTVPTDLETYPIVVLVHGSGASDRDETIGPNKPFADIAKGLASLGIATLRYDKRNFTYQEQMASMINSTIYEETVEDVLLAVEFISNNETINATSTYILGHSFGGHLIPKINEYQPDVQGYIMLAGNARLIQELIPIQYKYIYGIDGEISNDDQIILDTINVELSKLETLDELSEDAVILGAYKAYWEDYLTYNPLALANEITLPMLILQGERDYQVTMEDFKIWQDSIGNKENVTMQSFKDLNHLMMEGEGPSIPSEYNIKNVVAEEVVNVIAEFIN